MAHKYFSQTASYQNVNFYLDILDSHFLSKEEFGFFLEITDSADLKELFKGELYPSKKQIKLLTNFLDNPVYARDPFLNSFLKQCREYGITLCCFFDNIDISPETFFSLKKQNPAELLRILKSNRDLYPFYFL